MSDLKEPVNLYLFFSESAATPIPQIRNHGVRVRELLEQLVARSNGKLTLKVIDPLPFSEDEDRATELGISSVPISAAGDKLTSASRPPTPPTARNRFRTSTRSATSSSNTTSPS